MNSVIEQMLNQHESTTLSDKKNSIKEVVQEIMLCGLSRAGFFHSAAFYGGTALRIFYGLDRFSEDLDFSLAAPDPDFRLDAYLPALEKELASYGFRFQAEARKKTVDSDIQSAFVKGNTREHILICYADDRLARSIGGSELIKSNLSWIPRRRLLPALSKNTVCSRSPMKSGSTICRLCLRANSMP